MAGAVRVRRVDDRGVTVSSDDERVVDVVFDDHRVWSFHVLRDTETQVWPGRLAAWPTPLRRYLRRGHPPRRARRCDQGCLLRRRDRVRRGPGAGAGRQPARPRSSGWTSPASGWCRRSRPVTAMTSPPCSTPFSRSSKRCGPPGPSRSWATAPSSEPSGRAPSSATTTTRTSPTSVTPRHPVDVVRESFRLQREVNAQGFETVRYSGAAFKVLVEEADGFRRGLDVFGGFLDARSPLPHGRGRRRASNATGSTPSARRSSRAVDVPVPARPEKLLEAMYGPGWQVPDPAFKFETPQRTRSALNAWFRGPASQLLGLAAAFRAPQVRPAAARTLRQLPGISGRSPRRRGATVLDVGAGRGADTLWLARSGRARHRPTTT